MKLLVRRARKLERAAAQTKGPFEQALAAGAETRDRVDAGIVAAARLLRARAGRRQDRGYCPGGRDRRNARMPHHRARHARSETISGSCTTGELKRIGRVIAVKGGGRLIEWE